MSCKSKKNFFLTKIKNDVCHEYEREIPLLMRSRIFILIGKFGKFV